MRNILRDFTPVAAGERDTSSTWNAEFNLKLDKIAIPEGMYARGFRLDIDMTPSGSGTGTSYISSLIDSIEVYNEKGELVFQACADDGIGIASLFSHLLNADEVRTAFTKKVVAADSTSYNGWWEVLCAMPGKEFSIIVKFVAPPSDFLPTTFTGLATTMGCTFYASDEPGEQVLIEVEKRVNPDQVVKDGALAYMISVDNSELSSVISEIQAGSVRRTGESLKALENDTAHMLEGFHTAGAEGAAQYMPGVQSPGSANQLYAALYASEYLSSFLAKFSGSATAYVATAKPVGMAGVVAQ
jgi:hypothetical protein